jgi:secreted trypsin-like serine protease
MVANAVDIPGHRNITRTVARELSPDSDLGDRLVTIAVGDLTSSEINRALVRGAAYAESLIDLNLINSAALYLRGTTRLVPTSKTSLKAALSTASAGGESLAHA